MRFTVRVSNSTRFISRLKRLFLNDLDRIQALYPEHGCYEHLLTDGRGRCVYLGPVGCFLPGNARPPYCRLFPFWVVGGRVGYFAFELCQAQKGARSVNKVMKCLNMNTSQIFFLYNELRNAWLLDK